MRKNPGAIAFTRTPRGARCTASHWVKFTTAHFAAEYAGIRDPSGDGEVGGLGVGRPPGPGGSLVILYSDDLEASVAAIEAAGGAVTEGPYEFPGGRRFLFTDNSGNLLAVWTPA